MTQTTDRGQGITARRPSDKAASQHGRAARQPCMWLDC
jgi:hypothetical protein